MKAVAVVLAFLIASSALAKAPVAETVCVKYGPCPLDLSAFKCTDTPESSFIRRVWHGAPKAFMVIKLKETWYPYCAIDAALLQWLADLFRLRG